MRWSALAVTLFVACAGRQKPLANRASTPAGPVDCTARGNANVAPRIESMHLSEDLVVLSVIGLSPETTMYSVLGTWGCGPVDALSATSGGTWGAAVGGIEVRGLRPESPCAAGTFHIDLPYPDVSQFPVGETIACRPEIVDLASGVMLQNKLPQIVIEPP